MNGFIFLRFLVFAASTTALLCLLDNQASAFECTNKTDYNPQITCQTLSNRVIVNNQEELDAYAVDFGLENGQYRGLKINFHLSGADVEIHSPCSIIVDSNKSITANNLCLDGKKGVNSNSAPHTANIAGKYFILSEDEEVIIGGGSSVTASDLIMIGKKLVKIGTGVTAVIVNDISMSSLGGFSSSDTQILSGANISARNLSMIGERNVKIGDGTVTLSGDLSMNSYGGYSGSSTEVLQGLTVSARNISMTGQKTIYLGTGVHLNATNDITLSNTGSFGSSDVLILSSAIINAKNILMSGERTVRIASDVDMNVTNNFVMRSYGNFPGSETRIENAANIEAANFDLQSGNWGTITSGAVISIANHFHMQAVQCNVNAAAVIQANSKTGNCFNNVNDLPAPGSDQIDLRAGASVPMSFILNAGTDADGDLLYYKIVGGPAHGVITGCGDGTSSRNCTYIADNSFSGLETITYKVNDGIADSATYGTITIFVNFPPEMIGDQAFSGAEDTLISFTLNGAIDYEGDPLTYHIDTLPTVGTLSNCLQYENDLTCDYLPPPNFNGDVQFTYRANDGFSNSDTVSTVTITITPVNDAPTMLGDQEEQVNEDQNLNFSARGGADIEGDALTYEVVTYPQHGSISGCLNGSAILNCHYVPSPNYFGEDTFTYRSFDGELYSAAASVKIIINPVNDAPETAGEQIFEAISGSVLNFSVAAGSDIDSLNLSYEIVTEPSHGSLQNCFPGYSRACEYVPDSGYVGGDSFTYRVSDGELYSAPARIILTIDPLVQSSFVTQVVSGDFHSCALLNTGTVRCWGANQFGELGHGNTITIGNERGPYRHLYDAGSIELGAKALELSAGKNHTCALIEGGKVRCWGANHRGQAGFDGLFTALGDEPSELPSLLGDIPLNGHVIHISSGSYHTCALLLNGEVRCFGTFGNGKNNYVAPSYSVDLEIEGTVIQLASGFKHTCALLNNGKVKCWSGAGSGPGLDLGELGYNHQNDVGPNTAFDVPIGGNVVQISSKQSHTCALLDTGKVRCWGANFSGQLGYGITSNVGDGKGPTIINVGDISAGGDVKSIAAGIDHTCAVLMNGDVRCWGRGAEGQLGYGGRAAKIGDDELPSTISTVNLGGPAKSLALGRFHTCALLMNGQVRCWGKGDDGLGTLGYCNDLNVGVELPPSQAGDLSIIDPTENEVQVGPDRTVETNQLLELSASVTIPVGDKAILTWSKIFGPEGVSFEHSDREKTNVRFQLPGEYFLRLTANIDGRVMNDKLKVTVTEGKLNPIFAGGKNTCRISLSGQLECLGGGVAPSTISGTAQAISGLENLLDFDSDEEIHCASLQDGHAKCWGKIFGTGFGIDSDENTFEKLAVPGIQNVKKIATSRNTVCVLLSNGKINCWGKREASRYGMLGNGLRTNSLVPVEVNNINSAIDLRLGKSHACALTEAKTLFCWGKATIPNTLIRTSPEIVEGLAAIKDFSLGGNHSCVITEGGGITCWGADNRYGQQGRGDNNPTNPQYQLAVVPNVNNAAQLALGLFHTCFITQDGKAKCFGNNYFGQLGNGTRTDSFIPVEVIGVENATKISSGDNHTCALQLDNKIKCWGSNIDKQIKNTDASIITLPLTVFE
ncbi:MAG: tandem-95 repeat protein [Bdellovibrio sp.]|nr:tandem-95 repeat protein [Bdellovibrio sp.]